MSIKEKEPNANEIQNRDSVNTSKVKFDPKIEADMKTILSMGYDEK